MKEQLGELISRAIKLTPEQRVGQALFNAAVDSNNRYYNELAENVRGSFLDPFYHDGWDDPTIIAFLNDLGKVS